MKVDFSQVIMDLFTDKPLGATKQCVVVDEKHNFIRPQDDSKGYLMISLTVLSEQMTLKDLALQVLFTDRQDEKATAKEKADKFIIALKIKDSIDGVVDLKSEEISKIKSLISESYSTMIAGQAEKLLELTA